jgi:hypothetical protein
MAKRKRKSRKAPSPAQLAARKRFAAMAKAKAKNRAGKGKLAKNSLPMFPIYARRSSRKPWSLLGVMRDPENAKAVGTAIHRTYGLAVKVGRE